VDGAIGTVKLSAWIIQYAETHILVNLPGGRAERYSFVNPLTKSGMDERDSSNNPAF